MFGWLKSELSAIARSGEASRYALDLSDRKVSLIERTATGPKLRGAAEHRAPDFEDQLARLRRRVMGRGFGSAPVDLLLPQEVTLSRIETFPAEARRNLRDETWWRLDAITPFRPEDLCYDVALLRAEPNIGFLEVSIAAAPRDIVEEAVDYALDWGFAPQRVTTSREIEGFAQGPLLLQAEDLRGDTLSLRRAAAIVAVAALAFTVIGVGRGVTAREAQLREVERDAIFAQQDLDAALVLRAETLALADKAMLPAARRGARDLAVDWLEALAVALPPRTVVRRLTVDGSRIRIEGAAANAAAALAALEVSEAFTAPRLAAAPARLARNGGAETFVIEASLARVFDDPGPAAPSDERRSSEEPARASGGSQGDGA